MRWRISQLHERSEAAFEAWGRAVIRHRVWVLLFSAATTAALSLALPHMTSDNSAESFLLPGDPARRLYERFQREFGQDQMIFVAIKPPRVFDLVFLEKLRAFHREVEEEVPYLNEVTSLWNARHTRGEGDELIVEDLMEEWPRDAAEVEALRERVFANPLYRNTLVDETGRITTVTLEPFVYSTLGAEADELGGFADGPGAGDAPEWLSEAELRQTIGALRQVMARYEGPEFPMYLVGNAVGSHHTNDMLVRDVNFFMLGSVLVNALLLWLCFRRFSGVLLPVAAVLASLIATLGIMVLLEIPASASNQILPALLITVGICNAVHILTLFYQRITAGASREEAIVFALGHSGLAVLMACLTTAAGLLSFTSTELQQIFNLGVIAPIGVMLSFVYTVGTMPALLAVLPAPRPGRGGGARFREALGEGLARVGGWAAGHPWTVVAGAALVLALAAPGVARLHFSQYPLRWFPQGDPVREAAEFLDRELGGASSLEVVIDTGAENGLHDPTLLRRIESAIGVAEQVRYDGIRVHKSISLVDIVKETHKALNENRPTHYAIPDNRQLLAQELLLFENSGSDDLQDVTDTLFRTARVTLRMPNVDGMLFAGFIEALRTRMGETLGPGVEFYITGLGTLFARTFSMVNVSMARSYALALLIITPLMVLLIGNWRRGLLAMIPNLIPIYLAMALMGWLGIPLDNSTLLVGCVIIGLAVDDTIHFMHKYQRYLQESGDPARAVAQTLRTTGAAMLFTTLVLASGFFVVSFAYMVNAREFGMLACFAAVVALLADVVLGPALMMLASRRAA